LQFIAPVLIDMELPQFTGIQWGRIVQAKGANEPGGEKAKGIKARHLFYNLALMPP